MYKKISQPFHIFYEIATVCRKHFLNYFFISYYNVKHVEHFSAFFKFSYVYRINRIRIKKVTSLYSSKT